MTSLTCNHLELCLFVVSDTTYVNKKMSNLTQQYADIYLLQSHSTCFGRHSTHYQEY